MASIYTPDPNPPGEPKECQRCGELVDGEVIEGWWLERRNWQNPNEYVLYCMGCCVEKMNKWENHSNVANEQEARDTLQ